MNELTEEMLAWALRQGIEAQIQDGGFRLVQHGEAAVVDGDINFRALARHVLQSTIGGPR